MPVDAPAPTTSRDHKLPHHFKQLRARTKFTQFTLPNEKPGGAIMHKMVPAEGFEPPTTRLRSGCSTAELRRLKTAPLLSMQPTIGKQYGLCRSFGDQRNSLRNRCQTSLSRDVDISGTGSPSAPGSGPGSSGACTSG